MSDKNKYTVFTALALAVSILPPLVATGMQFPVWIEQSAEATVSGSVVFLAILCFVPLYKKILTVLKSPSAPIMWMIFTLVMAVLQSIAREMFIIGVIGTISNFAGWAIFAYRKKFKKEINNE